LSISPVSRTSSRFETQARIRPAAAAAVFGSLVGLAIGCAYLGGTLAQASTVRAHAERIEAATAAGFTEEALAAAAGGLNASALSIARRHDPYTVAGGAQRDRQATLMTARLEALRSTPSRVALRRISLGGAGVAARPFRLENALDASRDLECLTQAVYYEARGEGRDGMRAVAQVVLNRVRHAAFPKTVCGVVFQGAGRRTGCQFSFTCDGSMRAAVNRGAWARARDIASGALSGSVFAGVGNATHFHTTAVSPGWRTSMIRVNQVGQHLFYRFGGRSGSSGAFTYAARPSSGAEEPRLIQATMDPSGPVRDASSGAYGLLVGHDLEAEGKASTSAAPIAQIDSAEAATEAAPSAGTTTSPDV